MTYISKADAVTKLTASKQDHSCINLYSNNLLFNSTSIFYTDSAKTITAPAGNYVIPTNHNSIFMTLDSAGKIVGSISHTDGQTLDSTWIDDRIYESGVLVSNQVPIGGTDFTISGYVITDNAWTSRPYTNPKKWQINNGSLNSTACTNIDVTDMKGYDLMIYSGEHFDYHWGQHNWTQAFCHIKADSNRQSIFGNKIYYFKPDYWIPNINFTGGITYFRRMPNITTINDQWGNKKWWIDMANPAHDIAENYGVPRTSTKMNKGVTHSIEYNVYGYSFTMPKATRFSYLNDAWMVLPVSYILLGYEDYGTMLSQWYTYNGDPNYCTNMCVALVESLTVSDAVWRDDYSPTVGMKYTEANPYHWKTTFNSGSNYDNRVFAWLSTYFFNANTANCDQIQFDSEYYYKFLVSEQFGISFKALVDAVATKKLIVDGEQALGAVKPNISSYHGNLLEISGQWDSSINPSTVTSNIYYLDYHNYMNNLMPKENITGINKFYLGAYDSYIMSSISNYQIGPGWEHAIYGLVHNYDISKKIFAEMFSTYDHAMRVLPYTWNRQEIVEGGGNKEIRLSIPYLTSRPDQSPALNQSLAVWGMAYADGFFAWNDGTDFDEFNTNAQSQTLGRASWDWAYVGYWQVYQNKEIVEATTSWLVPDYQKSVGSWTSGNENYPVHLYAYHRPICRYKLSADGGTALVICTSPFNNGYTKETHTFRLPTKSNYTFTIDTWGTYTSVIRLTGLPTT